MMTFKLKKLRLLMLVFAISFVNLSYAQQKTITGTVLEEETGEALPGVTIVVEGTTSGTVTDISGNFSVKVPSDNSVLSFSFVGYATQKKPVKGVNSFNIVLKKDLMDLGEVVVVGYGVTKKSDLTGSVSSIKQEDFNNLSSATPEQLIQGRISGVQITQNNGEPGSGSQIRIRGASTIRSGQQPLYVIDGIPLDMSTSSPDGPSAAGIGNSQATNPLNFINPSDIESFDILKDASATAIYGSRGANGVVLITTKKGKEGISSIEYSAYASVSSLPKKLDVLTAAEWLSLRIDSLKIPADNENHFGYQTDWQDQIFRSAISQSHSLSLSGGTKKNSYRVSFNYLDQEGIIKKSSLTKYVSRLNLTQHAFNDKLLLEANVTASQIIENRVPVGAAGFEGDLLLNALKTNPTWPVYDLTGAPFQTVSQEERNPVAMLEYTNDATRSTRIIGGGSATLNIIEGLKYKMNVGLDYTNAIREISQSQKLTYMQASKGRAQINTKELLNYVIEHILTYNKSFGKSTIDAMAGYSFQHIERTGFNQQAGYFTTDKIDYIYQMQQGDAAYRQVSSWADTPEELQSFFGRVNYNYDDKYLVTATIRRDGSSKFGANHKYGNFPSLAFGWRLSEEDFIKKLDLFSNLKLRLGWGTTGNSEIAADNSTFLLKPDPGSTAIINNIPVTGFKIDKTPQPNLHWESTSSTNLGFDFGFFKGRLSGTIDLFRKTTKDLLVEQPTKAVSPTATFIANLDSGYVRNDGLELGITGIIIDKKSFNWTSTFNFTTIKNNAYHILNSNASIIPTGQIQGQGLTGAYSQAYANNHPMGSFYMLSVDTIDKKGKIQFIKKTNKGDSLIFLGTALPKFTCGWNNTFKYKNLDLNFFFDVVYGNKIFNNTALLLDKSNIKQSKNALSVYAYDRANYTNSTKVSDRFLEDGSFLRLTSASLGYNFNFSKLGWIQSLRVYVSGSNLFILTKYTGYDPDVSSKADMNGVRALGIDITSYPKARTFLLGLNVTF
jgi:TonB-dependent starch-binding outer membrane protein SusC